jgi:hypothetical protein
MPEQKHIETQSDGNCNSHQSLYAVVAVEAKDNPETVLNLSSLL